MRSAIPRIREGVRIAFCALLLAALAAGPVAAQAASFLPHRAVYDIGLAASRGSASIVRAEGKLEFEWSDVCSGWTVKQRTRVQLVGADGEVFDFGWSLNALESKDGRGYRFFIRRINADGSSEEVSGEAELDRAGGPGQASFAEPAARRVELAKGTLFPTRHSLLLIEAARDGALPLGRTVFDGSGEDGRFWVNAALSQSWPGDAPKGIDSPLLGGQESWRLHLAYFGVDETVAEPEHEQSLRLYANGVVDEMLLDYGDFVLEADLATLEALPEPDCPAQ